MAKIAYDDYYLEDDERVKLLVSLTGETENSFHIQGIEYKLIKSFIIGKQPNGKNVEWWLCKKTTGRTDLLNLSSKANYYSSR